MGANKIGRNELCLCGSGLKYKYCHGDVIKTADAKQIANLAMSQMIREERIKKGVICKHGVLKTEHCKDCKVGD